MEGMEQHVIASVGRTYPVGHLQRGQVKHGDGVCVAILHGSTRESEYLLACREAHLMDYVFEGLQSKPGSIKTVLDSAFDKMDDKLQEENKGEAGGPFRNELLWRSRDNSCVVVVCKGMVYSMGYGDGRVVLCRAGKDYNIHGSSAIICMRIFVDSKPHSEERHFRFYREESLTTDDEFLFVASENIWEYVHEPCGGLSPAFFTRVEAFGLVEASKQIIGFQRDVPKIFIAIPLTKTLESRVFTPVKMEPDEDGRRPLLPLIDGEIPVPEPRTTLSLSMFVLPPVVESGPRGVTDWICKRPSSPISYLRGESACCTIVMRLGNLQEWFVTGEHDAIVNSSAGGAVLKNECWSTLTCGPGQAVSTRAPGLKVPKIIHTAEPVFGMPALILRNCYQSCLAEARKWGVKYIAFPAISCGVNGFDVERAALIALDTVISSSHGFGEIHFVFNNLKMLETWANEFVGARYDPYAIDYRSEIFYGQQI